MIKIVMDGDGKQLLATFVRGVVNAFINGGLGSIAMITLDPKDFNVEAGLGKLATAFCAFGLIGVVNYLLHSPLLREIAPDLKPEHAVLIEKAVAAALERKTGVAVRDGVQ